ncbi:(2Fe-2S)-binding protein [Phytoactinopolyspora mesophila]|uniref:2Fe-2S iron-sulfur cluster binding domain-containing protein n=1 Tax=Phytoactinopolyspora mesophila TaxID=2650750 RepID=A0A7K3MAL7_9ACTN|nr:(2Fe-2S)-binding protein [Phytoactinopolyspora mesophila]NDL60361.1 2Fe-2S iron-sulfur cluster binding domain-containing protein [Phytoactinopolyspora mesophila]
MDPAARSTDVVVDLEVNGRREVHTVPARTLLVHFLRENLGLTGTHVGCDTTQCGACTVELDGVAVKSCTVLAAQAAGSSVRTIEDVSLGTENGLDPVQQAFWDEHGLQCGFCTPGMVLAVRQLLRDNPKPTDDEVRHGIDGNLCRCTGYQNIVAAALKAASTQEPATTKATSTAKAD